MRPKAPRRRARRARWFREDVFAWLTFFLASSSALLGANLWLNRRVLPRDRSFPDAVSDPKILILAFDRIVNQPAPRKIDARELRQHLEALRDAGYVAVSLRAILGFFESGTPLPEKSLLLTFDHGYLSTYDAVDPILRDLGWSAVLFVMTERQDRRDPFFVYWDRIEHMVASGLWEIGSHGHRGHDPIAVDEKGTEGPFFIRTMWLADQGRVETWEEFSKRVSLDHRRAKRLLEDHTGGPILAYAPPLRDVAGLSAAPEAHEITDRIVRSTYRLALYDDRFGVNDRLSDPHRLKRLRVEPSWSTEELMQRVHYAMGDVSPKGSSDEERWVTGSGTARREGDELVVEGKKRADLWRAGSQRAEDWEVELDFWSDGGELWIVQESDRGPELWRWGGTATRTYLQTRRPGERTDVVKSYRASITPGRWHHLRLVKRGLGIWVEMDSQAVRDHPTFLPGRWRGNVGLVQWNPGEARLRVKHLRFRTIPFEARVIDSTFPPEEIQAAIADAPELAAISPRLPERNGEISTHTRDDELVELLSRRFGWEVVPTIRIPGGPAADSAAALRMALALAASGDYSGLRIELDSVRPLEKSHLNRLFEQKARELDWRPGRLVVVDLGGPRELLQGRITRPRTETETGTGTATGK